MRDPKSVQEAVGLLRHYRSTKRVRWFFIGFTGLLAAAGLAALVAGVWQIAVFVGLVVWGMAWAFRFSRRHESQVKEWLEREMTRTGSDEKTG